MKYLAAYALIKLGGAEPTKDKVKAVLVAGGVTPDVARIDELFTNFSGKDFNGIVEKGKGKLVAGAGSSAAAAPAAAAGKPAAAAAPAKKEEPKKEEEDEEMGFGLFD